MKKNVIKTLGALAALSLFACPAVWADEGAAAAKVTVGVTDTTPPLVYRDNLGKLIGFEVDLLQEIGRRTGRELDFKIIEWKDKDEELGSKKIDVLASAFTVTEERKTLYGLTNPHLKNTQAIIVSADSPIRGKNDLSGKKICMEEGSSAVPIVQTYKLSSGPVAGVEEKAGTDACLLALISGEFEATVLDLLPASYYVKNSPGQFRILADNFAEEDIAFAMRPDDKALVNDFNKALAAMSTDGTMKTLHGKWFGQEK